MTIEYPKNIHTKALHTQAENIHNKDIVRRIISAVLTPVHTLHHRLNQLCLTAARLRVLAGGARRTTFEYDPVRDRLSAVCGETGALTRMHSEDFFIGGGYKKMLPEHQWAQFENFFHGGKSETSEEFLVGIGSSVRWLRLTLRRGKKGRISGEATDVDSLIRERECALTAAATDPLTGLLNRSGFECAFRAARRRKPDGGLLILADIDDFKQINDIHGHICGDAALRTLAERLRASLRSGDLIARFGGDEFVIFLPAEKENEQAIARLSENLRHIPIECNPESEFSCSLGAAYSSGESVEALIALADKALYCVKRGDKGSYAIYSQPVKDAG